MILKPITFLFVYAHYYEQVRGFAPIGMLELWNNGKIYIDDRTKNG